MKAEELRFYAQTAKEEKEVTEKEIKEEFEPVYEKLEPWIFDQLKETVQDDPSVKEYTFYDNWLVYPTNLLNVIGFRAYVKTRLTALGYKVTMQEPGNRTLPFIKVSW